MLIESYQFRRNTLQKPTPYDFINLQYLRRDIITFKRRLRLENENYSMDVAWNFVDNSLVSKPYQPNT